MRDLTAIKFVEKLKELLNKNLITSEKEYLFEILIPETKNNNPILTKNFLSDLYENYNLSGRAIGFNFLGKLEENSEYVFFVLQDPFYIGIEKKTKEIVMFDPEFEMVHLRLAKNIEQFFQVILLIYEYGLPSWVYEKQYSKEDRNKLFENITKILDSKYLTYYEQSYGN
ncbi:hypothetical protein [Aureivirga sp. CE67]|uniref:hypothetical protein n=1 Tax=Aureivirga sp. CE67 TaxID=1788983 RepID=UPI0018C8E671|nr:hypothetical protein [Aureivirga sp. CE67]